MAIIILIPKIRFVLYFIVFIRLTDMNASHKVQVSNKVTSEQIPQWKHGVRVLGISESFTKDVAQSMVAGIVMRGDYRIDGFGFCRPTLGGNDATNLLIGLYHRLGRQDIRAWMLGGNIISWFNVVDIDKIYDETNVPVVCVTYNSSEGIEKYLRQYFPDTWQERRDMIEQVGMRTEVELATGHSVFLTNAGLSIVRAKQLVDLFTIDGRVPEPIRVARMLAAGLFRDFVGTDYNLK